MKVRSPTRWSSTYRRDWSGSSLSSRRSATGCQIELGASAGLIDHRNVSMPNRTSEWKSLLLLRQAVPLRDQRRRQQPCLSTWEMQLKGQNPRNQCFQTRRGFRNLASGALDHLRRSMDSWPITNKRAKAETISNAMSKSQRWRGTRPSQVWSFSNQKNMRDENLSPKERETFDRGWGR